LRNKILYVYTENLNFFYRLNKELIRYNIKFEILQSKIPKIPSIILTTSEEKEKLQSTFGNLIYISYSKDDNFNHYILKVLASNRIQYKNNYSELTFAIDPGIKHIGIVTFLDDYYLISHTIYDKKDFIALIKDYVLCFQKKNEDLMKLIFKFGGGVVPITTNLINKVYNYFKSRMKMKVFLIDESKSSKIKIKDKRKRLKTTHEASALLLALRDGIEINEMNFYKLNKEYRLQKLNNKKMFEDANEKSNELKMELHEIIERILNGQISLSKASILAKDTIKNLNSKRQKILIIEQ